MKLFFWKKNSKNKLYIFLKVLYMPIKHNKLAMQTLAVPPATHGISKASLPLERQEGLKYDRPFQSPRPLRPVFYDAENDKIEDKSKNEKEEVFKSDILKKK